VLLQVVFRALAWAAWWNTLAADLGSGQQPAVLGGRYVPDRRIGTLVATIL
jgi:hypothetical protein